jgi:hypothetical protein
LLKKIYKMQHLEGSGTPVLYTYIGRTVLKRVTADVVNRAPSCVVSIMTTTVVKGVDTP